MVVSFIYNNYILQYIFVISLQIQRNTYKHNKIVYVLNSIKIESSIIYLFINFNFFLKTTKI